MLIAALLVVAPPLLAQEQAEEAPQPRQELPSTVTAPVADGVAKPGEYSILFDFPRLDLWLARDDQLLYAAVVANSRGWVAFGVGMQVMDGARIIMGFIGRDGPMISEQVGVEHKHVAAESPITSAAVVSEVDRVTTLEIQIPIALVEPLVAPDGLLELITAYGTRDSLTRIHRFNRDVGVYLR